MTPRTRKRVPVAADVYRRRRRTSKHRWPVWTEDGEEGRWKEDERDERLSRRRGARSRAVAHCHAVARMGLRRTSQSVWRPAVVRERVTVGM